jgi:hypothetical protein
MTLEAASRLLTDWITRNPAELAAQKAAVEHYGELFRPDNIDNLTEEQFKAFLLFKNNKHWTGIHRQPNIYADLERLKTTLKALLDERQPIQVRLDKITDVTSPLYIRGLGRAVLTPILMCVYPEKYAVYNSISEAALIRLGRNGTRPTDSFGRRYLGINDTCNKIAGEINQPLSLVDVMYSLMVQGTDSPLMPSPVRKSNEATASATLEIEVASTEAVGESLLFPLEKFLEEFIVSNWEKTLLGKTLALHAEDEERATQYVTAVGRIDILAREKESHDWVVIELKKGKGSDEVVGQLLRYMGWVKRHKAKGSENVRGIIITSAADDWIKYAMLASRDISFYTYRVSFDLVEEPPA